MKLGNDINTMFNINQKKGINMNAIKKIGLSALAGSLVAMSAHAAEVTMSGGASVAVTSNAKTNKSTFYQNDSITFTVSGETDGGLTVTTSMELDGDTAGTTAGMDSRSIKIAHPDFGTVTFAGHGGSTVIGGWDDVTPTAYEEVWALTKTSAATPVGNSSIGGFGGGGDFLSHAVNNNEVIKQVKKMSFFFIITSLNIRN